MVWRCCCGDRWRSSEAARDAQRESQFASLIVSSCCVICVFAAGQAVHHAMGTSVDSLPNPFLPPPSRFVLDEAAFMAAIETDDPPPELSAIELVPLVEVLTAYR